MKKKSILRLGIERGWIEFKIVVKDPQTIIWTMFIFAIYILVLWLQRGTEINGVSLALLTLPGLLGIQIANSGFSDVASGIAFEKEDGTLLRAKAVPRGIPAFFIAKIVGTCLMTFIYLIALFVMSLIVVPDVIGSINVSYVPLLLLYVLLGLLATAPFGAVLGSIVKTSGSGWGLSLAPLMILVAISGIFTRSLHSGDGCRWWRRCFRCIGLGLVFVRSFLPKLLRHWRLAVVGAPGKRLAC